MAVAGMGYTHSGPPQSRVSKLHHFPETLPWEMASLASSVSPSPKLSSSGQASLDHADRKMKSETELMPEWTPTLIWNYPGGRSLLSHLTCLQSTMP